MNHATLQHALIAMRAGRLDEAANLLVRPEVRPHRRAQEVLTDLCRRLVERGYEHLNADRLAEARRDALRVMAIEPGTPEASALNTQVGRRVAEAQQRASRAAGGLALARRLADLGHSTMARKTLPDTDEAGKQRLLAQLDLRKLERQTLIERGKTALARNDFNVVHRVIQRLATFPPSSEIEALNQEVEAHAARVANEHFEDGQPEAAHALLPLMNPAEPLSQICRDLARAASDLQRGDANAALPCLQRAARRFPTAVWLSEVILQTRVLRDTHETLAAGLLGSLADSGQSEPAPASQRATQALAWVRPSPNPLLIQRPVGMPLPDSPLILNQGDQPLAIISTTARLSLAGASHPGPEVLALLRTAGPGPTFTRDEEGHLIDCPSGLTVNHKPTTTAVLTDGDRLGLGPRLRLRYLRANPASQTAVLELTAGRFVTPHLRRIVLLAGELLVGPHRGCHLRDPELTTPVTFRPAADGLIVDGLPLVPDGQPETVNGKTWSVTRLESAIT